MSGAFSPYRVLAGLATSFGSDTLQVGEGGSRASVDSGSGSSQWRHQRDLGKSVAAAAGAAYAASGSEGQSSAASACEEEDDVPDIDRGGRRAAGSDGDNSCVSPAAGASGRPSVEGASGASVSFSGIDSTAGEHNEDDVAVAAGLAPLLVLPEQKHSRADAAAPSARGAVVVSIAADTHVESSRHVVPAVTAPTASALSHLRTAACSSARNVYFWASVLYVCYAAGMLLIDYGEDRATRADVNWQYVGWGVLHLVDAGFYVASWRALGYPYVSVVMIPEALNTVGALLYLTSASMYHLEDAPAFANVWTTRVHQVELAAASLELVAAFGWVYTWWLTYARKPGRGWTLDDVDAWANLLTVVPAAVYLVYCVRVSLDGSYYLTSSLYVLADVLYAAGSGAYLLSAMRDDGWFWFLPQPTAGRCVWPRQRARAAQEADAPLLRHAAGTAMQRSRLTVVVPVSLSSSAGSGSEAAAGFWAAGPPASVDSTLTSVGSTSTDYSAVVTVVDEIAGVAPVAQPVAHGGALGWQAALAHITGSGSGGGSDGVALSRQVKPSRWPAGWSKFRGAASSRYDGSGGYDRHAGKRTAFKLERRFSSAGPAVFSAALNFSLARGDSDTAGAARPLLSPGQAAAAAGGSGIHTAFRRPIEAWGADDG